MVSEDLELHTPLHVPPLIVGAWIFKHPSHGNLLLLGPTSVFFTDVSVCEGKLSSRRLGITVTSAPVLILNVVRHPLMYGSTFQGSLSEFAC